MSSVEVEARTIDEAVERALEVLDVPRDRVRIEILAESSRGIFGLGAQRARVRATIREDPAVGTSGAGPGVSRETSSLIASRAREVLEVLMGHLVAMPRIEERAEGGLIRFELSGSSAGLLIGKGGRTLDALEYLVNRIVLRDETGPAPSRIELDVEQYRARRAEALADLARRAASKAMHTGRPVLLDPMSPRERRLIHLALKDDRGVVSESDGQGDSRRVVVRPALPR
jgi:spoIIIJ-associated protein